MKKLTIVVISLLIQALVTSTYAQTATATQLANRIAQKMKDTLGLTNGQQAQVFARNILINNLKVAVRQNTTNPDSLRKKMQRIESRRDSMYQSVLPAAKYNLYLQKKKNLVSAN